MSIAPDTPPAGRPKGRPPMPPEKRRKPHTISFTDEEWEALTRLSRASSRAGISDFISWKLRLTPKS